ncbi:MAG TPA: glycosyltransferase family 8 protein [Steroidobacteraceae bacterium]|jgi:lipopolysaccharide biosynthesis glycosyltransferase|nr:glycosyltransferase family 8 protein [Steroidobacteraceae bacterium]
MGPVSGGATDPIHIAVTFDANYALPLAAMLQSLVARLDPQRHLVLHAFGQQIAAETWDRLMRSVPAGRMTWHRVDVDASQLLQQGFTTRGYEHISPVCYFRLLLPDWLPTLEKLLYLDCDLIVCDDIGALWDIDLGAAAFAAVKEYSSVATPARLADTIRYPRELGVSPQQALFNTGVLLMNLQRWRETRLALRAFSYLRVLGRDVHWYDQEALNVVAGAECSNLDRRWNVPAKWVDELPDTRAAIVHYLTAQKPWNWDYRLGQQRLFQDALDRTAWAGWRPQAPRLRGTARALAVLRKAARKRLTRARRALLDLRRRREYRSAAPKALGDIEPGSGLESVGREIRLFVTTDSIDAQFAAVIGAYVDAGVDRAFIITGDTTRVADALPPSLRSKTHIVDRHGAAGESVLRHLLDRHGVAHWCVLGDAHRILVDAEGRPIDLRRTCVQLEQDGDDIAEIIEEPGGMLALTARDLRSGRVYLGAATVDAVALACDEPVFRSRVALVRYSEDLLLDVGAVLSGNVRRSARTLQIRLLQPAGAA